MALIVDGYNVIFHVLHRRLNLDSGECEKWRADLLGRLEHFRMATGEEITVVFDGGEKGAHLARVQHFGGLLVIFSDPASDADEEIKQIVRESSGARELAVVTDDNDIARYVRRFRAKVWSIEELLRRMEDEGKSDEDTAADPAFKFSGPERYEVDGWVETFGDLTEEDLEEELDED